MQGFSLCLLLALKKKLTWSLTTPPTIPMLLSGKLCKETGPPSAADLDNLRAETMLLSDKLRKVTGNAKTQDTGLREPPYANSGLNDPPLQATTFPPIRKTGQALRRGPLYIKGEGANAVRNSVRCPHPIKHWRVRSYPQLPRVPPNALANHRTPLLRT